MFIQVLPPEESLKSVYILADIRYSYLLCQRHPDKVFIFGDNTQRIGTKGQAIIRPCLNTYGIRTKVAPNKSKAAYFYDSSLVMFKMLLEQDMKAIHKLRSSYDIVFHANGYGNGEARLHETSPLCYQHLVSVLNTYCKGDYWCPRLHQSQYLLTLMEQRSASSTQNAQSDLLNESVSSFNDQLQ